MAGNRVIYVAGYSRCGSTLLDMALSSHPEICGTGELTYLVDDWSHGDRACSCGAAYARCGFWGGIREKFAFEPELARTLREVDRRGALSRLLRGEMDPTLTSRYGEFQRHLLDYVRHRADKPIVLDSSKSARDAAGRFLALGMFAEQHVDVLHLVRSPEATLNSYRRVGSNWSLEGHGPRRLAPLLRAVVGWRLANEIAARYGPEASGTYIRVRYEDLVADPDETLKLIGNRLGIDLSIVQARISAGEQLSACHNVGGNRVRFGGTVFGAPQTGPSRVASLYDRILVSMIAGQTKRRLWHPPTELSP